METRPRIHRLDIEKSETVYGDIKRYAPAFLTRQGFACSAAFVVWSASESVHWVALDQGGLMLTDWRPRLSVRIHPVVWGRKLAVDRTYMHEVLQFVLEGCNVERVEALVPAFAPDGLKRWCERAGLRCEGYLHNACVYDSKVSNGVMFAYTGGENGW